MERGIDWMEKKTGAQKVPGALVRRAGKELREFIFSRLGFSNGLLLLENMKKSL